MLWVLHCIALGEYEEAEEQFQQGLASQRDGSQLLGSYWLFYLGKVAFDMGDYARAAQQYQESLAGAPDFDDLELAALNHDALGRLNMAQGDDIQAREHFLAALQAADVANHPS